MNAAELAIDAPPANSAAADGAITGVVTSRAYVVGCLLPSVEALAQVMRKLRAARATSDVVGFAIPLEGDPAQGVVKTRGDVPPRRRFDLKEFLLTALDPHRPRGRWGRWAPGRNVALAVDVLGDLTRWIVGIHTFRIPLEDGESVSVLARPNHAAAIHRVRGDSHEGTAGMLATLAVPPELATEYARRLAAGDCILTTCETDEGRMNRDRKWMQRAGADHVFGPIFQVVEYGARPA